MERGVRAVSAHLVQCVVSTIQMVVERGVRAASAHPGRTHGWGWSGKPDAGRTSCRFGGDDTTLCVWDVQTGQWLRTLEGHTRGVSAVSLTPDGRYAVSGSWDYTLREWNLESGQCLGMIVLSAHIMAIFIRYPQIIVSLSTGNVNFLEIPRLKIEKPIITPLRLWLYGIEGKPGKWDDNITALCEWCGKRFVTEKKILDAIAGITRDARLAPDDSPCLKLPQEAFNDPRLISECPHCHQPLKFNPFVVDNRGRY